jgi:hypothetical protein
LGLELSKENLKLISIWESCFPTFIGIKFIIILLEDGMPSHHHIVFYYLAKITNKELNKQKIKLQETEVDSYTWLSLNNIKYLLNFDKKNLNNVNDDSEEIKSYQISKDENKEIYVKLNDFFDQRRFKNKNEYKETSCITMGTMFTIEIYYKYFSNYSNL